MSDAPQWLTPAEAAARLGLTRAGLHYRVAFGLLPALVFVGRPHRHHHRRITRIEAHDIDPTVAPALPPNAQISAAELAAWLRVNVSTIYQLANAGVLSSVSRPPSQGGITFHRRAVLAFIADHAND